ncbi:hypothetical protein HCN51_31255 [Nonomuraea sp. FMUSA5-5]|uniref:Lipoprotein n=1 Tax=Nonomuraea composti TaxID=2720023 RepID=A0ABX1BBW7_9ACTN|nr:hypothetical protein [Nonomuraea sp. FMUSA5-5]NJP93869.1 hypothetical protein [Nonomuraea sp. FMUSA5-5]
MTARSKGRSSSALLVVWSLFAASACFLACCLLYEVFEPLVGWQAGHGALWLGALSLTPVGPGLRGLLAPGRAMGGRPRRLGWSGVWAPPEHHS